jgi:hypothetical protein
MPEQSIAPVTTNVSGSGKRRVGSLIGGGILCLFAVVFFLGGTWAVWVDRVDRSGGFVTIGTTKLTTGTYAFQSPLHGDGPRWLYGETVWGTARFRATSQTTHPLFIGIARTDDVARYLNGTGYATIQHLVTGDVTTHEGDAPFMAPTRASIWAASTQGNGQQTLRWKPRNGDWSIVLMNVDASPGVALRGDLGAQAPFLPWVGGGFLIIAALFGCIGVGLLVRGSRVPQKSAPYGPESPPASAASAPDAATDKEDVNV